MGLGAKTGDGRRWFVVLEPVEKGGEDSQGATDRGAVVAGVMQAAYCHSGVFERGQRVAGVCFE
jgi:hypothetical protein